MFADGRQEVKLPDGQVVKLSDLGDYPIWSAAALGSAQSADVTLFNYSEGATLPGVNNGTVRADKRHINVNYEGKMPDSDSMYIASVALELDYDAPFTAIGQVLDSLYLSIKIAGDKELFQAIGRHVPQGTGLGGFSNVNAQFSYSNGAPILNNIRPLALPLFVGPNKTFRSTLEMPGGAFTTASADFIVREVWRGTRMRYTQ